MTTYRIIMAKFFKRHVKLEKTDVVLRFTWLVVALFGPSLPILNALIALLSKIYFVLLFGSDLEVLDMKSE
eukprot:2154131-Amphidinium_carterae.1